MFMYISIAVVFIFLLLVFAVLPAFFFRLAFTTKSNKASVLSARHNRLDNRLFNQERVQKERDWLKTADCSDVFIQSKAGLHLHAYKIKNPAFKGKWLIGAHGYTASCDQFVNMGVARRFYEQGYSILLPDARSHGKSEGKYIGFGWPDRLDIINWANHIIKDEKDCSILLYGVSMGAATVMMASGEKLPQNIKAIVEDCGYTSVEDELSYQLKKTFHLPAFLFVGLTSLYSKHFAGYDLRQASAIKQVEKSNTPILFIHGDSDTFVPSYMLEELYNAAKCEKEKLLVAGAGHGIASFQNPELYWKTVDSFIQSYMV